MRALRRSALAVLTVLALAACGTVTGEQGAVAGTPGAADLMEARDGLARRADVPTPSAKPTPSRLPSPKPAGTKTTNDASRLRTLPADTTQVIVVKANGFGTSTGTLQAFGKRGGNWTPAFDSMPARLGTKGFKDSKVEGDLTTPTGVYSFGGTMYGIAGNPGVRYGYHKLVANDWWNENPATDGYNSFFHGPDPGGASEALWETNPQYRYFAVINYNIPVREANPPRGSGIFLHVSVPGRSTAGCVALVESDLVKVLRWLDPAAKPRIVMAPASELDRY
ncbi:L,D-peptidoglycan transpeptidase YkuD, ErfK/YbiS/YcfS/YnhG family [Asanoa hainanensis]|uniref:L,D-peptidoglycan transpeptidase YkuD, ErfK/YbiS/YcfS/YnhG family n=1 Tax=Asanoa hainanensis TaxID=560556 RepID=A0A239GEJ5_9ACTN|nr:L,D-transpeptidase family protein [Asanoa hainanensis]SNS67570.1 L,D-peptidoglycan transpeptidase YkuD, ErfK/YbiS/YcfS/YnhG family [Asanoa hainanensis]